MSGKEERKEKRFGSSEEKGGKILAPEGKKEKESKKPPKKDKSTSIREGKRGERGKQKKKPIPKPTSRRGEKEFKFYNEEENKRAPKEFI